MFWIFFLRRVAFDGFDRKSLTIALLLIILLFLAATNRFGEFDPAGIVQYYFINYHILGFSYLDALLKDPHGLIHSHTFGLFSLGAITQIPAIILAKIGINDFHSIRATYSEYTSSAIDIGLDSFAEVNAFNTILGTFYKDFGILGCTFPAFIYGRLLIRFYYESFTSNLYKSLFLLLAFSWVVGFMISPIERPYFWLIAMVIAFNLAIQKSLQK